MAQTKQVRLTIVSTPSVLGRLKTVFKPHGWMAGGEDAPLGVCYVDTFLGRLQVNVALLLWVTVSLRNPRSIQTVSRKFEIAEEDIYLTARALKRIPVQVANSLFPVVWEARLEERASQRGLLLNWSHLRDVLYNQKKQKIHLVLLEGILKRMGPLALDIPDVRNALQLLFARNAETTSRSWDEFLRAFVREKGRPGRPRKVEYEELLLMRKSDPSKYTYGQLAIRFQQKHPHFKLETRTVRDRIKAAAAYDRKKKAGNRRTPQG